MILKNKITFFMVMMFLLILSASASAQTPSGLEVSSPRFIYNVNSKYNFIYANSTSSNRNPFTAEIVQEVSALFRNSGTKSIKRVFWQFIIYKDAARTKIQYIYTLKNKTALSPGDEIRLSKTGSFWGNSEHLEAKVFRIEYTDGTVWEGTKTKN